MPAALLTLQRANADVAELLTGCAAISVIAGNGITLVVCMSAIQQMIMFADYVND